METADVARLYLAAASAPPCARKARPASGSSPKNFPTGSRCSAMPPGSGALRYATEEGAAESALGIIRRTRYIELSAHAGFTDAYVERMLFPERE